MSAAVRAFSSFLRSGGAKVLLDDASHLKIAAPAPKRVESMFVFYITVRAAVNHIVHSDSADENSELILSSYMLLEKEANN